MRTPPLPPARRLLALCLCLGFSPRGWRVWSAGRSSASAEDWPGFRGPRGDGTSLEKGIPIHWNGPEGKNIAWKVEVPGTGHASPIVWQDGSSWSPAAKRPRIASCCVSIARRARRSGSRSCSTSPLEDKHPLNSYASSTPATDGRAVYVTFLDRTEMLVAAYDFEGRQRWLVRPGEFFSKHGYCSSPVLFENLVILNGDHDGDGYLVALDRDTGKTVWKTAPREQHPQLLHADHPPDRRPHADGPVGQQVRGQLRPATTARGTGSSTGRPSSSSPRWSTTASCCF